MLQIYNSLSQSKQVFKPLQPGKVGIYICGITIYDFCHVGHARTYVAFDSIVRYLRFGGYQVQVIRNITDIDDKIINRAAEKQQTISQLTDYFEQKMHEDFDELGILRPDQQPKATESVSEIITFIQTLIEKQHAYAGANGDVYYDVASFADYGKLSKQKLDELNAGERVGVAEDKRNPTDFVLWKASKQGEPSWSSPWGDGRPGWHIECSAMAKKCLGSHFDIHGGGFDLRFPHHENEIAQSEAANGCQMANYWMHAGMVQVDEQKMSKSLNNFFTIREVLKNYRAESVRYFLVASHYRSPLSYSQENLNAANASLERLYTALLDLDLAALPKFDGDKRADINQYVSDFKQAMDDDFNTPEAVAVLFELAREINRLKQNNPQQALPLAASLIHLGGILGLLQQDPQAFLQSPAGAIAETQVDNDEEKIAALIAARNQAREEKNWQQADAIRDQLADMGIQLEDKQGETRWRKT